MERGLSKSVVQSTPGGRTTVFTQEMVPGQRYPFLYLGKVPAVAVRGERGSVVLQKVFEPTRNPFVLFANKFRQRIIKTPPVAGF